MFEYKSSPATRRDGLKTRLTLFLFPFLIYHHPQLPFTLLSSTPPNLSFPPLTSSKCPTSSTSSLFVSLLFCENASFGGTTSPISCSPLTLFSLRLLFSLASQGANRPNGIGFLAIQNLLLDPQAQVIAAVRDPASASDLLALEKSSEGRVKVVKMDVGDLESVKVSVFFMREGREWRKGREGKRKTS